MDWGLSIVMTVVTLVIIVFFTTIGYEITKTAIKKDCENFQAFAIDGTVYECKER